MTMKTLVAVGTGMAIGLLLAVFGSEAVILWPRIVLGFALVMAGMVVAALLVAGRDPEPEFRRYRYKPDPRRWGP